MPDIARFVVAPPLRCCQPVNDPHRLTCGELAASWRRGAADLPIGYYCLAHSQPGDEPIPSSYLFRRVSLTLEVQLAGASMLPGQAQQEALNRITAAVEAAGGVVNLHTVSSAVGRYTPPAPLRGGRPRPGRV